MKKIISVILCISMLAASAVFAIPAAAAEGKIALSATGKVTDPMTGTGTFTLTISMKENTGVNTLNLKIGYNADTLEFDSITNGVVFSEENGGAMSVADTASNPIALYFEHTGYENIAATGKIVTIKFNIIDDMGEFDFTYQVDEENTYAVDGDNLPVSLNITAANDVSKTTQHVNTALPTTIKPTCTEPGHTGYVFCLRCNEILYGEDVEIPATGHTPVTVPGYPATCTEFGLTDGTKCAVCEATIIPGMLIPPTGHHYVDGVCEDCGDVMKSGWIVLENGDVAYFDSEGVRDTNFSNDGLYYTVEGETLKQWQEIDGNTYYFKKATGEKLTGLQFVYWVLYDFGEFGICENADGYTGTYDHVYYVDGVAFTGEQNGTYYEGGRKQTGWIVTEDGTIYVSTTSGNKLVGMKYVKGILYEYDENGICQDVTGYTGYYKWSNGSANFVNGVIA